MSTRFITKVGSLDDIQNFPEDGGIAFYLGQLFARTEAGLFALNAAPVGLNVYIDPANGDDANDGFTPASAKATLDGTNGAWSLVTAGHGDTIHLLSDGATTGTLRVDAAFTWSKNNTHFVGHSSGVSLSNRSRIAPTPSTTAFANFFTISASGCRFANLQWFHGFTAGTTSEIAVTVSGGRNLFVNCHIAGMGDTDAAGAQSTGSRHLKITTTGENMFVDCTIGIDTVLRTVANASVEFAGGCPRNQFINCTFPFFGNAAGVLGVKVAAAAGSDRFQNFINCRFENAIGSTSTQMDAISTLAANMGGLLVFENCALVGITGYGTDATSRAQIRILGPQPNNGAGISVEPAA